MSCFIHNHLFIVTIPIAISLTVTYTQLENEQRPLMLAIPPVEECDLHVAAFHDPSDTMLTRKSDSQYTFSSGSSNNPPHWQIRRKPSAPQKIFYPTSADNTARTSRSEVCLKEKCQ